jgi:hypothetical protein
MTYIRRGPAIKNSKLEKTYLCHPPLLATTVQLLFKKNATVGTPQSENIIEDTRLYKL